MYLSSIKKLAPLIIFSIVAVVMTANHLFHEGFPRNDSILYNVFWQHYFTQELLNGQFFPRWLSNYYHELGAPVFYFYAPLPFYFLSIIGVITGDSGETFTVLSVGQLAIFLFSGLAFYTFVKRYTPPFWAIAVSVFYMTMPYHYIDIERRGALGESFAYIWIPLIMIGICHTHKTWRILLVSALCYAGLVLSHLPSALLTALMLMIFALYTAPKKRWLQAVTFTALLGFIGVMASAFYVFPAMLMQDTISPDAWVTASGIHFKATSWLIGGEGPVTFYFYKALLLSCLPAILLILLARALKKHMTSDQKHAGLFKACVFTICLAWLLMTELAQPLWEHISFIAQIQFPWRLGPLIEFCSVLLVALIAPHLFNYISKTVPMRIKSEYVLVPPMLVLIMAGVIHAFSFPLGVSSVATLDISCPVEYRPKWVIESELYSFSKEQSDKFKDINVSRKAHDTSFLRWETSVIALPSIAALRRLATGESIAERKSEGAVFISIAAVLQKPATLRIKKVYYPHWLLLDQKGRHIPIYPDRETGLILVDLPVGAHQLSLQYQSLFPEKIGIMVSVLTLIAVMFVLRVFGRRQFL